MPAVPGRISEMLESMEYLKPEMLKGMPVKGCGMSLRVDFNGAAMIPVGYDFNHEEFTAMSWSLAL